MTDIRVMPEDLQAAGLCLPGGRRWFTTYRLDFNAFLKEGISVDTLRETGCPLAERACEVAEARAAKHESEGNS